MDAASARLESVTLFRANTPLRFGSPTHAGPPYPTLASSGAPDYPARQNSRQEVARLPGKQALALS